MGTGERWNKQSSFVLKKTPPRFEEKHDDSPTRFSTFPFVILPYTLNTKDREAILKRAEKMCEKSMESYGTTDDGTRRCSNGGGDERRSVSETSGLERDSSGSMGVDDPEKNIKTGTFR